MMKYLITFFVLVVVNKDNKMKFLERLESKIEIKSYID